MKWIVFLSLGFPLSLLAQPAVVDINQASYATISVPGRPDFLSASGNSAWVIDDNNSLIRKIAVGKDQPLLKVGVAGACAAPVTAFHAIWVMSCAEKKLYRIDDSKGKVLAKISIGVADPHGEMSLAVGDGSIWALTDSGGVLTRIDPQTNAVKATVKVAPRSYCAGYGYHAIWVTSTGESLVQRIDVRTNAVVARIKVGLKPRFFSVGDRGVWTLNQGDGTVTRIDAATNRVTATIDVRAKGPGGDIAEGGGKVWIVSTNPGRAVETINTATNKIETIYSQVSRDDKGARVDGAVRVAGKYVWVSGLFRQKVWVFKK